MARRLVRPAQSSAAQGGLVLPEHLTFNRPEYGWSSEAEFHAAQRAWLVEHGVDDWEAFAPVLRASKRAHARSVAELDSMARAQWRDTNASGDTPPWPPPAA
jgi:hypothetical protein